VSVGALLIEAIVPGTMFLESPTFPVPDVARLLTALHTAGTPDPFYPPLKRHVAYCSTLGRGIASSARSGSACGKWANAGLSHT